MIKTKPQDKNEKTPPMPAHNTARMGTCAFIMAALTFLTLGFADMRLSQSASERGKSTHETRHSKEIHDYARHVKAAKPTDPGQNHSAPRLLSLDPLPMDIIGKTVRELRIIKSHTKDNAHVNTYDSAAFCTVHTASFTRLPVYIHTHIYGLWSVDARNTPLHPRAPPHALG